jgi:hypothetical protein
MTRSLAICVLGLAAVLLAPSAAAAEEFKGSTSKGLPAYVRTDPTDHVKTFAVTWRTGDCTRPGYTLKRKTTYSLPPLDRSKPGSFVDRGQYRVKYSDARVRFRVGARGRMVSDTRWKGTFAAKAFVNFNDGSEMTCRLRRISWHADS